MPAIRAKTDISTPTITMEGTRKGIKYTKDIINEVELTCDPLCDESDGTTQIVYPLEASARAAFRTRDGKKLTEHQWAVYDFTRTIPRGRVSTYLAVCKAIGRGSPRSVGSALRHNPFAPFVPCHRVIASNLYVGGFFGEWGTLNSGKKAGGKCQRKIKMLAMENVGFTVDGYLVDKSLIWKS